MIKILVVSDSHSNQELLQILALKHQDCSYFLHLGDSELPSFFLSPFISVKGNCDFEEYPLYREISLPIGKLFCEHGQNYQFLDIDYIKSLNCKIYLHGHTHKHYLKEVDGIYIANPGSLTRPRDGNKGTYLIISIDDKNINFDFKYID